LKNNLNFQRFKPNIMIIPEYERINIIALTLFEIFFMEIKIFSIISEKSKTPGNYICFAIFDFYKIN
jgi:hypothetical protein